MNENLEKIEKNVIIAKFKADPNIPEFGPLTFLGSLNID